MAEAITLETGDKSPLFDALDSKGERHNLTDLITSGKVTLMKMIIQRRHVNRGITVTHRLIILK